MSYFVDLFANNFHGHIAVGILVIIFFFICFLIQLLWSKKLHNLSTNILITTGIFFTFFGISQGLIGFDVNNVENSLPELIAGIKTAFLVSVVGVFCAIVLKLLSIIFEIIYKNNIENSSDYDITDLVSNQSRIIEILNKQIIQNEQNIQSQTEINNKLIKAISGNEDSSLLGQIKNIRIDTNDKFEELIGAFSSFAKNMLDNNQKSFIEALSNVIRDFNTKITEQFGDNFKQLNNAVGNLLVWQENYKNYIEKSQNILTEINSNLDKQSNDYKILVNSTNDFINASKNIFEVVENIKEQRELLNKNANSLALVLENLKNNLPEIMIKINEFSTISLNNYEKISNENAKLQKHFENVNNKLIISVSEQRTTLNNEFKEISNLMQQEFKNNSEKLQENIYKTQHSMLEIINRHLLSFDNEFNNYNEKLNTQLINVLTEASKGVNSQIKVLDNELENALKNISNNIVSISSKFVNDYQKITNSLNIATKELVNAIRNNGNV